MTNLLLYKQGRSGEYLLLFSTVTLRITVHNVTMPINQQCLVYITVIVVISVNSLPAEEHNTDNLHTGFSTLCPEERVESGGGERGWKLKQEIGLNRTELSSLLSSI